jgi:hypothetical protein
VARVRTAHDARKVLVRNLTRRGIGSNNAAITEEQMGLFKDLIDGILSTPTMSKADLERANRIKQEEKEDFLRRRNEESYRREEEQRRQD